ncbi:MAG: hypothetical protein LKJ90_05945 [Faecalibacterium sp.]|jgi:23S rRNA pseudoU1915 N3-methylase RlmH|nr:hypothetical protein [Faecalibacterium sp.]
MQVSSVSSIGGDSESAVDREIALYQQELTQLTQNELKATREGNSDSVEQIEKQIQKIEQKIEKLKSYSQSGSSGGTSPAAPAFAQNAQGSPLQNAQQSEGAGEQLSAGGLNLLV